jgi:ABC-type transporter Mla subunit MlaD
LRRSREALSELAQSRKQEDDLSEALARAAALLADIEKDFASGATFDTRKLEDSLTGLERLLNDSMLSVAGSSTLDELTKGVKDQLKPYKAQMDAAVYKQTFDNLLLKRLREHFAMPRLSLFYV